MKAAFYTRQGPADDVLSVAEQPTPSPRAGEVAVRIRVSGVNPSDVKSRQGLMGPMRFPLVIPQSDGAGEIVGVGEGVSRDRVGKRVWLWNAQWLRPFGTAAEFIALPAEQAVNLPDHISYEAGACFGIPALTAFNAVRLVDGRPGQTILVSGGAGAVSHYAIQIAKAQGLRVLATVSGEAKAAAAREAGADGVVNYKSADVGEAVMALTGGKPIDAIVELDVSANAKFIPAILKAHGVVVVYGYSTPSAPLPLQWLMRSSVTVKFMLVYDLTAEARKAAIDGLTALLEADVLRHAIGARFPLEKIAAAHKAVETGAVIGNVVVDCGADSAEH
jgi:NADPH2:quinone reductase